MSRAPTLAAFTAGTLLASAVAFAVPTDVTRFRAFDAFAQALALVETNYVDPVDEQAVLRDGVRGMLHNLDVHSTYLPPNRYQKVSSGHRRRVRRDRRRARARLHRRRAAERAAVSDRRRGRTGSPAEVAGIQLDDRVVSIDGAPTAEVGNELREAGAWEAQVARRLGHAGHRDGAARRLERSRKSFTLVRAQVKQATVHSQGARGARRISRDQPVRRGDRRRTSSSRSPI